jgi:hypothetical protein
MKEKIKKLERAERRLKKSAKDKERPVPHFVFGGSPELREAEERGKKILRFDFGCEDNANKESEE